MKITPQKYAAALAYTLESSPDQKKTIQDFLILLRRKKALRLLPKILASFERIWNQQHGILKAKVWYPAQFPESPKLLKESLQKTGASSIELDEVADGALIGGLKLLVDDTLIDASIQGQLASFIQKAS